MVFSANAHSITVLEGESARDSATRKAPRRGTRQATRRPEEAWSHRRGVRPWQAKQNTLPFATPNQWSTAHKSTLCVGVTGQNRKSYVAFFGYHKQEFPKFRNSEEIPGIPAKTNLQRYYARIPEFPKFRRNSGIPGIPEIPEIPEFRNFFYRAGTKVACGFFCLLLFKKRNFVKF